MLHIAGLAKRFGRRPILDGLDLELAAGEYVAIVGESGAGKSTLLNLIAGLDVPDAGRIEIGGDVMFDITAHDPHSRPSPADAGEGGFERSARVMTEDARTRLRRTKIGFVFQAFHILPHLTVAQNVELPLVLLGVAPGQRAARTQELLAAVGLGERGGSWPRELSGGELQRVALARALVHRPALVLADEPTGNLDPETADGVLRLLARTIKERGATGILVTHSPHAASTADRVLRLERGRLSEAPRTAADARRPTHTV
jgi:putative ABC transport system ATP-binding protein